MPTSKLILSFSDATNVESIKYHEAEGFNIGVQETAGGEVKNVYLEHGVTMENGRALVNAIVRFAKDGAAHNINFAPNFVPETIPKKNQIVFGSFDMRGVEPVTFTGPGAFTVTTTGGSVVEIPFEELINAEGSWEGYCEKLEDVVTIEGAKCFFE